MNKIIGFIGCGNMGQAMMGGIIKAGLAAPDNIIVGDLDERSLKKASENYGVKITTDNNEVAKNSDILILSIKPNIYPIVIKGIVTKYHIIAHMGGKKPSIICIPKAVPGTRHSKIENKHIFPIIGIPPNFF
jgi:pyrroline-5-carboxylate reductase